MNQSQKKFKDVYLVSILLAFMAMMLWFFGIAFKARFFYVMLGACTLVHAFLIFCLYVRMQVEKISYKRTKKDKFLLLLSGLLTVGLPLGAFLSGGNAWALLLVLINSFCLRICPNLNYATLSE